MKTSLRILTLLFFSVFLLPALPAQQGNPFELAPRLPEQPEETAEPAKEEVGNPFDIVPGEQATAPPPQPLPEIKPLVPDGRDRFNFVVTIVQLVLLAVLVTLLRSLIGRTFQAFGNDNMFNQLYRDREARGGFPFFLLTLLFYGNAGIFIFHLAEQLNAAIPGGLFQQLGIGIGIVAALMTMKTFLLRLVRFIFPVREEINRYLFLITVFMVVIGLFLIPVNLLLAYGPSGGYNPLINGTLIVITLIYLWRSLRGLLIANQKVNILGFHFFLYICTIEIAPVLIFGKLISNQL